MAWVSELLLGHAPEPFLQGRNSRAWGHTHSGTAGIGPPLPGSVLTPFCPQFRNFKIIYRRYAGLYFCICVDVNDNNLAYLEAIHNFVEVSQVLTEEALKACPGPSAASLCCMGLSVHPTSPSSPPSSAAASYLPSLPFCAPTLPLTPVTV